MERCGDSAVTRALSALDRIYLRRACELAARGRGSTSPNPAVGAVIARGATTLGEGYHHARGRPHAEAEALDDAAARGNDVAGATLYVTLEPCDHTGLTPPCSQALGAARIGRVVIGALDPNPRTAGRGVARLTGYEMQVVVARDPWATELIEDFTCSIAGSRPYVRLKLAASLDGCVAPGPGVRCWLTGAEARAYVRDLRATYDAVLVGAGTLRTDDPLLSVRPLRSRRRPYVRVVACGRIVPSADRAVLRPLDGYAATMLLVPAEVDLRFAALERVAEVEIVPVCGRGTGTLDLRAALEGLHARGIASVLCEGGPTLASSMLAAGLVDRLDWIVAPTLIGGAAPVRALGAVGSTPLSFERVERLGPDVLLSAFLGPKETNV